MWLGSARLVPSVPLTQAEPHLKVTPHGAGRLNLSAVLAYVLSVSWTERATRQLI